MACRWYLSAGRGSGADAEGNAVAPLLADHTAGAWCATAQHCGVWLVAHAATAAFDRVPGIAPLTRAAAAGLGLDVAGLPDDADDPDLALAVARRLVLRQLLDADDFGAVLSLPMAALAEPGRHRAAARLLAYKGGIDITGLRDADRVGDALALILPRIKARVVAGQSSPGGTFIDDFDGEGSTVDLADHVPSGGTAWTRASGSTGWGVVTSANILRNNTADSAGALYLCDDQGSAAQYSQYVLQAAGNAFAVHRASAATDWIGYRWGSSVVQVYRRQSGGFTLLGQSAGGAGGNLLRFESGADDDHELFLNGVSVVGPVNDTFNNTITRQGFNCRSSGTYSLADNYEAGTLGGGGATYGQVTSQGAPAAAFATAGAATFAAALAGDTQSLAVAAVAAASFDAGLDGGAPALGTALGNELIAGGGEIYSDDSGQGAPTLGFGLTAALAPFAWADAAAAGGAWSDRTGAADIWADRAPETATWTDE